MGSEVIEACIPVIAGNQKTQNMYLSSEKAIAISVGSAGQVEPLKLLSVYIFSMYFWK